VGWSTFIAPTGNAAPELVPWPITKSHRQPVVRSARAIIITKQTRNCVLDRHHGVRVKDSLHIVHPRVDDHGLDRKFAPVRLSCAPSQHRGADVRRSYHEFGDGETASLRSKTTRRVSKVIAVTQQGTVDGFLSGDRGAPLGEVEVVGVGQLVVETGLRTVVDDVQITSQRGGRTASDIMPTYQPERKAESCR
jgi:hypothetical protein